MAKNRQRTKTLGSVMLTCLLGMTSSSELLAAAPVHVEWAHKVVDTILPQNNEYGSKPSFVEWPDANGNKPTKNRSVCGTFTTLLLKHSYGYTDSDFKAWFGSPSPDSSTYHDTIEAEKGFQRIQKAADILPGDIIAIEYPPGGSVTGHTMTAVSTASPRAATSPKVQGTTQHDITVIDSSSGHHGPSDTRSLGNGKFDDGVGRGDVRLYTDSQGVIVGYTWSTSGGTYYKQSTRHLVVGRITDTTPLVDTDPLAFLGPPREDQVAALSL